MLLIAAKVLTNANAKTDLVIDIFLSLTPPCFFELLIAFTEKKVPLKSWKLMLAALDNFALCD